MYVTPLSSHFTRRESSIPTGGFWNWSGRDDPAWNETQVVQLVNYS